MQPVRVIKHRDIIQNILLRFIPGLVIPPLHTLLLQAAKEAFHHGIISTIAFPAHAALEAMGLQ